MLIIKNLRIQYKQAVIIRDLSLSVGKGEIVGIVGKNGAGKTTLFNALYQNVKYNGEISVNGIGISRSDIGFLETENYFYPYMTGEEYLSFFFGKYATEKDKDLIDSFDLPLQKFVHNYSTGMKKKLALLAVVLLDKPIFILDEPFNGIDFEGVKLLYETIKLLKQQNKIVLISSHIIETLFNTCDRVAVLQDGIINNIIPKSKFNELINSCL